MEPLESTSIHFIQAGVTKLIALLPDKRFNPIERDTYNRLSIMQFEQTRDFLILHYKATERTGPFWDYVRNMDIPDTLAQKIELFRSNGRLFRFEDELFGEANWQSVLMGQGIMPERWDPMADALDVNVVAKQVQGIREAVRETALRLPTHQEFLTRFCAAPEPVD